LCPSCEIAFEFRVGEAGDVHGNGNLIIFTDGSISDLNTVVKNQPGK